MCVVPLHINCNMHLSQAWSHGMALSGPMWELSSPCERCVEVVALSMQVEFSETLSSLRFHGSWSLALQVCLVGRVGVTQLLMISGFAFLSVCTGANSFTVTERHEISPTISWIIKRLNDHWRWKRWKHSKSANQQISKLLLHPKAPVSKRRASKTLRVPASNVHQKREVFSMISRSAHLRKRVSIAYPKKETATADQTVSNCQNNPKSNAVKLIFDPAFNFFVWTCLASMAYHHVSLLVQSWCLNTLPWQAVSETLLRLLHQSACNSHRLTQHNTAEETWFVVSWCFL